MEEILYPSQPVRCILTGPSEGGKKIFSNKISFILFNEFEKIYIYSPSLHQDFYQKLIKCFNNYVPIHIIPNILNGEDINVVFDEIINGKDFQKSDTEL